MRGSVYYEELCVLWGALCIMRGSVYYEELCVLWGALYIMRGSVYYEELCVLWGALCIMRDSVYYEGLCVLWGTLCIMRDSVYYEGLRRIFSFSAQNCTWKPRFYKPDTLAASDSKFDNSNRTMCLKVGVLVYTVSRLSKCQGQLSIAFLFYGRFIVAKQTAQLFCP